MLAGRRAGKWRRVRLLPIPGVFQPRSDSLMLADLAARRTRAGDRALDVFTGSGVVAVALARAGAEAWAVDISRRAVASARLNARLNGSRVRALRGDAFEPVAAMRFDLITANPPYVPGDPELPDAGASRAWEGGEDGRALLDPFLRRAPGHLEPGGRLLVVHSSICGINRTLELMEAGGLVAAVAERRHGPLGPLVAARAATLERRGLLRPGERTEEVVAIEGRAPVTEGARAPLAALSG